MVRVGGSSSRPVTGSYTAGFQNPVAKNKVGMAAMIPPEGDDHQPHDTDLVTAKDLPVFPGSDRRIRARRIFHQESTSPIRTSAMWASSMRVSPESLIISAMFGHPDPRIEHPIEHIHHEMPDQRHYADEGKTPPTARGMSSAHHPRRSGSRPLPRPRRKPLRVMTPPVDHSGHRQKPGRWPPAKGRSAPRGDPGSFPLPVAPLARAVRM